MIKHFSVTVEHPRNRRITYSNAENFIITPSCVKIRGRETDGTRYNLINDEPWVNVIIEREDA